MKIEHFHSRIFIYTPSGIIFLGLLVILSFLITHQPRVVIVPHHNVVAHLRRQVLEQVAARRLRTQTIILISPDHFNPDQHGFTSSNQAWTTTTATIPYDPITGKDFAPLVINNPNALKNDHGIFNLLPDIASVFPQAKIVPLIIGQALKPKDLDPLVNVLNQSCNADCLIIASVDFSHYLPATLAEVHDTYSRKILTNHDLTHVMDLEVDSPQALYLALAYSLYQNANHFVLIYHTNSSTMMGNPDIESTSHFMGWLEQGAVRKVTDQTFVYATNLSHDHNQKTVGDRFFYGADQTNTNLDQAQTPATNVIINPIAGDISSISTKDKILTVNLADDLAVAGVVRNKNWQLTLLPLTGNQNHRTLTRGQAKANQLHELLRFIPPTFTVSPQTGRITFTP